MRDLAVKRDRFSNIATDYSALYKYTSQKEKLAYSSCVLNFVWNQWNNFWRDYWLSHVMGGYYLDGSILPPICTNYSDKQACHFLLHKLGKKKRHAGEAIVGCYQEPTWGDPTIIENLAVSLARNHTHLSYVLGILAIYKLDLAHFQQIRNALTHLNNENVYYLHTLSGYYSFSANQKIIDILDSINIRTSDSCFDSLISNMKGMLHNLT